MKLSSLAARLPPDFVVTLADVGSAGGLHRRWRPIRDHVAAVLFDPLDAASAQGRDRYFPVALAGEKGRATIHVTKRVSMTSALRPNAELLRRFWDKSEHTEIVRSFEVPTDTLDNIVRENSLKLDAIKIDVQGGEHDILLGARAALERVILAEIEVSFFERYERLKAFDAVLGLMHEAGFALIDIGRIKRYRYRNSLGVINPGLGLGDRAGRIAFCDAVFLQGEETLLQRMKSEESDFALKLISILLVYGKADIAAFAFDEGRDQLPKEASEALAQFFRSVSGKGLGPRSLHRGLDYLARRV